MYGTGILFEEPNPTGSRPRDLIVFIEEGNRALVNKATQHKPTFSLLDLRWLLPSQREEEEMIGALASRLVAVACNRMVRNSHIMMDHPAGTYWEVKK